MISRKVIEQLSYLALIAVCLNLHANINNLKGTFDILKDEYKQFSVINGAIADQTGYIMHLYDYGTLGQMRKLTMPDQSTVLVPDISNATEVVKLVHLFFHRTPGTIGRGDFVLTQDLRAASDEEKQNVIQAIAWIMAQVKKVEGEIAQSPKHKASISQQLKAISLKDLTIKSELPHFTYLANLASSSSVIDILKGKPEALKVFKLIWQSMQQEKSTKPIFPPQTTNCVLQTIVYKLADNNKSLIKAFYEKLNELITSFKKDEPSSTIFIDDRTLDQNWLDEQFKPSDKQMLGEQLTFAADNLEQLKQHYETIVYLALLPGALPQEAGYIKAYYHYDPSDPTKVVEFPDCMETTLRNIINFLLYIKDNLTFSFTKIPNANPVQQLKDFYQKNISAADTESRHLHDQWVQVVENIPFVAYDSKVGAIEMAPNLGKIGYIKVPQGINVGNDYIPVGPDDIVYEVRASLRNFILIFNHLFQLNLFENEVGNTPEEKTASAFARPDFIKTYFPQLCEKLNITFDGFFKKDTDIIDTIDSMDYGPAITTILSFDSTNVNLITQNGHGHIEIVGEKKVAEKDPLLRWLYSNSQTILDPSVKFFDNYLFSLPYLAVYKIPANVSYCLSKMDPVHSFNLLFYQPLGNADYVRNLIHELITYRIQLNEYAIRFLFYLSDAIPDENQKQLAALNMYSIITRHPNWKTSKGLADIKKSSVQEIIKTASEASKSETLNIGLSGSRLFIALIEKGQAYTEAIQAASVAIKSDNLLIKESGEHLFNALFEKGQGYPEAIKTASDMITSGWSHFRGSGLLLFQALFENKKGYSEAIQAASDAIKYDNLLIKESGEHLFNALFEKGQGYPEAMHIASDALRSENVDIQNSGLMLYMALVAKGQAYPEAMQAASEAIQSKNLRTHNLGIRLYGALVEKEQAYPAAIKAASSATKSEKSLIHGLTLFEALVEKEQAYPESIQAAAEALKSEDETIRESVLTLFEALFRKEKGFVGAGQAASEALKSKNLEIRYSAYKLFRIIFKQLEEIQSKSLTPELQETIEHVIEIGKATDISTSQGEAIARMAQELEKKIQKK